MAWIAKSRLKQAQNILEIARFGNLADQKGEFLGFSDSLLGLPEIFDHHLGRHGLHQGLSWGWIATIWLAHILTESNHRKRPVQSWVKQA
ncbi:MAG: hypothetical protein Q7U34_13395 [Anaerolineales bacterium]|nr:hypothetical protein [Anaerolineales bacterium]MDP3183699.1 hypothetical protein [Anaerolineales bacterium]